MALNKKSSLGDLNYLVKIDDNGFILSANVRN